MNLRIPSIDIKSDCSTKFFRVQHTSRIRLSALPALRTSFLFACGILVSHVSSLSFTVWMCLGLLSTGVCLVVALIPTRRLVTRRPLAQALAIGFGILSLGAGRDVQFHSVPHHHISHRIYNPVSSTTCVEGQVIEPPNISDWSVRFILSADTLLSLPDAFPVTGRILVQGSPSGWHPAAGDVIITCGELVSLPDRRNPADFDYGAYLKKQGIRAQLRIEALDSTAFIGSRMSRVGSIAASLSAYTSKSITNHIRGEHGRAIATSLILGDRDLMSNSTASWFRLTGLSHLLAISGLHVLLVGMMVHALSGPLLFRLSIPYRTAEVIRSTFTITVLLGYLLMCGAAASAVRAVVMAGVHLTGRALQLRGHPLNSLGVAAIVLLMIRPDQITEVGFQLSFAAVSGLLILLPTISGVIPDAWYRIRGARFVFSPLLVSLVAILATAPVLSAHFGMVAFAGLILNLVAIPLTALALSASLLVFITSGLSATLADIFGASVSFCAFVLVNIARFGTSTMAWMSAHTVVDRPGLIGAYIAFLLAITVNPRRRNRMILVGTGILVLVVWADVFSGSARPAVEMLLLDVGHGDAVLLSLPGGRHLLVDAGQANSYVDHGHRSILKHCDRFGIRQLDMVVVSHADNDHVGGVFSVLRGIPVGGLVLPKRDVQPEVFVQLRQLADSLGTAIIEVGAGDELHLGRHVEARILSPPVRLPVAATENDVSIVLHVLFGSTGILLMGDAEQESEQRLCAEYGERLISSIIKVGHHGSRTSSLPCLVQMADPDWATISVGRASTYGLPDEEVVSRWEESGASVRITSERGAIWLTSDGSNIREIDWKSR